MRHILILLLTAFFTLSLAAAEELVMDFKPAMKRLRGEFRSEKVFFSKAPALALDGKVTLKKKDPVAGYHFYIFPKQKNLAGKKLRLSFKLKRISGIAPLRAGYRVFGNGNKLLSQRHISFPASKNGQWENVDFDFQVPPLSGIENVNIGFNLRQETSENNRIIIDEVKLLNADDSKLLNLPPASIGAAALFFNKGKLELIKNGVPSFKIVIPPKDNAIAAYAAREIRDHVKLMTGTAPQIITDASYKGCALWIGGTALAEKFGVSPSMLPPENWVVARVGNAVIISGGDKSGVKLNDIISRRTIALGTLSAAYEFLEQIFGCRWYWPGKVGTVAPQHKNLTIDALYKTGFPQYDCRALFFDISEDPAIPFRDVVIWQRRNRLGGSANDPIAMHSFRNFPDQFAKTHPEYFALQPNGKRKNTKAQGVHLCLTNPDVVREAAKWAVSYFKKNPHRKFVSIMPGDSNDLFYCRCAKCTAEVSEHKGKEGIHSNAVWGFVNKVAAVVAKECPGKFIKCCAYSDYLRRPDFALLPNVAVTLCYSAVPRGGNDYKLPWRALIDEWRTTGATLYVWEYWNNSRFTRGVFGAPAIWPRQLKELYLLDSTQVAGRVIELSDIDSYGVRKGTWTDWRYDALNLFIAMRLMWNHSCDVESELKKFHRDFYGPAESTMEQFHNEMEKAWIKGAYQANGSNVWDWEVCWTKVYPAEFVDRMMGLLKKAVQETAGKEPYHTRAKMTLQGYLPFERNSRMFRGAQVRGQEKIEVPRGTAPVIDGRVDAKEWSNAAVIDGFSDSFNAYKVQSKTTMKFRHDGKYLYVAVTATLPAEHAKIRKFPASRGRRDGFLWDFDSAEFVFAGKDNERYQFILAPDNALFDAAWSGKKELNAALKWQCPGIRFATYSSEGFWTGEMAIPLAELKLKNPAAPGVFIANFSRNHHYTAKDGKHRWEQSMWMPTFGTFHNTERYGKLILK